MKPQLNVQMPLMELVEQWVATYCLGVVQQRYPKHASPNFKQHDAADAMFQTLFDETMDRVTVTIDSPGWPSMVIPIHKDTTLRVETRHAK